MKKDEKMSIEDMTAYMRIVPERKASYAEFPDTMNDEIKEYLGKQGINALYTHQTEMFEKAGRGENTVITTSTASGKTLAFLLPVLQKILEDPLTRAIFVYPTKALASDQYRSLQPVLEYFGEGKIQAGVYDGDTMPAERSRIRKSANIILTNPEMLNSAFLPNHSKYGFDFIFANLRYIVIDELHSYRGAFGAHLANIFRRMHRICQYYHSSPQFLCSSATIANPVELAKKVCGTAFSLIEKDGSPSPVREYRIIQPPEIKGHNDKVYGRYAASTVAADMLPDLVKEQRHFIAFGKSRRTVEVILKEARDKLDAAGFLSQADSRKIAGYRGGYTPLERKEIERKMMSGELNGLVSTNALELGIDIGSLDTTVIVGYPGTRASFWQQSGRAGRNGQTCVNYLILENQPFDQYIAVEPGWLFEGKSENAIVDPDNLLIELAHIRAAAAELPLSLDDAALFPSLGEIIPVLMKAEEVKSMAGRFAWSGPAFPAGDYSLRNMDKTRFKLVLWGLRSLKERLEAPEYVKKQVEEERPGVHKQYSFFKLSEKWNEFCETVIKNGESGGAFLKTAKRVEIEKHNLILIVDSYFYEDWLKIPENAKSIKNILKFHAVCPQDMEIVVRTEEDMERKKKTEGKLKRRYEDKF